MNSTRRPPRLLLDHARAIKQQPRQQIEADLEIVRRAVSSRHNHLDSIGLDDEAKALSVAWLRLRHLVENNIDQLALPADD